MRSLIKKFEDRVTLPIEIDEIRDAIIDLGIQDRIVFCDEDLDTEELRGVLKQWREHGSVYGEPRWTTLIVYPRGVEVEWQRVICAKELVHVFDKQIVKTQTPEMIEKLAEKVLGPFEGLSDSPADFMATVDKLAAYQWINLLFPRAARNVARQMIKNGAKGPEEIAEWAAIPLEYVYMVLDEAWEEISEILSKIGNGENLA